MSFQSVQMGSELAPRARRERSLCLQGLLEPAKWLALVAMAVDHYGKIVDQDHYLETHTIGRIAYPLFAAIVGTRLALSPELAGRYVRHLLLWAVASQPVFVLAGRGWSDGNIMFTLLLGVLAAVAVGLFPARVWTAITVLGAIVAASFLVDFGTLGVAMVPAMQAAVTRWGRKGLWAAGPLGVAANIVPEWPGLELVDFAALVATPVLILCLRARFVLPRLPAPLFYAFYPAHLLALHFYDLAS